MLLSRGDVKYLQFCVCVCVFLTRCRHGFFLNVRCLTSVVNFIIRRMLTSFPLCPFEYDDVNQTMQQCNRHVGKIGRVRPHPSIGRGSICMHVWGRKHGHGRLEYLPPLFNPEEY